MTRTSPVDTRVRFSFASEFASLLGLTLCVCASTARAQEAGPPASAPPPSSAAAESDAPVEFVGGELQEAPEEPAPAEAPSTSGGPSDQNAPSFDDVAVAAGSGGSVSRVTAIVTDDLTGVESVIVFYRSGDEVLYREAKLVAGEGGLFLGQLPAGIQNVGFSYYLEAKDAAGNLAQLGTPERPFVVAPAGESDLVRIERQANVAPPEPTIHPAWIALAIGTSVVVTVGAAAFWVDFIRIQLLLREPLTDAYRAQVEQAGIADLAIASVLSVAAVVTVGLGVGLLVFAAIDEE